MCIKILVINIGLLKLKDWNMRSDASLTRHRVG